MIPIDDTVAAHAFAAEKSHSLGLVRVSWSHDWDRRSTPICVTNRLPRSRILRCMAEVATSRASVHAKSLEAMAAAE